MLTACARNNVKLIIAFQRPHHATWLKARDLIRQGVIGKVTQIQLDDGGNLLVLRRLDQTQVASVNVGIDKARSAAVCICCRSINSFFIDISFRYMIWRKSKIRA